jgi:arsenate reductase
MKVLLVVSMVIASLLQAYGQSSGKKLSIVFVCEHGAARSVMASKYFERLANENGILVNAIFRGLSPDSSINRTTKAELTKDGFTLKNENPKRLTREDVQNSDLVVTLDCVLPETYNGYSTRLLKYRGIPSINENYVLARDSIKRIVNDVLIKIKSKAVK